MKALRQEGQTHLLGDVVAARAVTLSCAGRLQRPHGAAGGVAMHRLLNMRWVLHSAAAPAPRWRALDGRAGSVIGAARWDVSSLLEVQPILLARVDGSARWQRRFEETIPREQCQQGGVSLLP
jgi:hypothetical protein